MQAPSSKRGTNNNNRKSSFSSGLKQKYGHLLHQTSFDSSFEVKSNISTSTSEPKNENDFFTQSSPSSSDSFLLGSKLLDAPSDSPSVKTSSSSKRLSHSFTPTQPERFNQSLNFWHSANDAPSPSGSVVDDGLLNYSKDLTSSKLAMSSVFESDSSPYLLDHDIPSDMASADHTFESNGSKDRSHGTFSKSYGGMAGGLTNISEMGEPTGFSWTSNMVLDNNNVPDAAAANTTSTSLDQEEEQDDDVSSSKILSQSLLDQVMPEPQVSYRSSPLAKYVNNSPSTIRQPSPFNPSRSSPTLPSTPLNTHDLPSASTTPVDVLKRRLERTEETMRQYEQDLVSLQTEVTTLQDANSLLRKDLDEEKRRVVREEKEVYELEQDKEMYRVENVGLQTQVDEMSDVLRVRDTVELEQTKELSETVIKLETVLQKCAFLEDKVLEMSRTSTLELDNVTARLKEYEEKCEFLSLELIKNTPVHVDVSSVETQSDFPSFTPKPIHILTCTQTAVSFVHISVQTDLEEIAAPNSATNEDLSAFIVNDGSIFNHDQLQRDFEDHELKTGQIDKLTAMVEQNESRIMEVRSSLNDIHSKTMQVRKDLTCNEHFGKEVERWVDDMKSSVESVETFILEASQALKSEKRRSERLSEMIGNRVVATIECQTEPLPMDSKYAQTKNETILLNAGIQTTQVNMVDQDMQTNDEGETEGIEEDSLQFYFAKQDTSLLSPRTTRTEASTQTMLLFDMMDSDFITRTRKRSSGGLGLVPTPETATVYASTSLTSNLVQLFVTMMCLLVGYVLYNVYEVFWFIRSALRVARESKIAII